MPRRPRGASPNNQSNSMRARSLRSGSADARRVEDSLRAAAWIDVLRSGRAKCGYRCGDERRSLHRHRRLERADETEHAPAIGRGTMPLRSAIVRLILIVRPPGPPRLTPRYPILSRLPAALCGTGSRSLPQSGQGRGRPRTPHPACLQRTRAGAASAARRNQPRPRHHDDEGEQNGELLAKSGHGSVPTLPAEAGKSTPGRVIGRDRPKSARTFAVCTPGPDRRGIEASVIGSGRTDRSNEVGNHRKQWR